MTLVAATKTIGFSDYIRFLKYTWIDFFREGIPQLSDRVYAQYPRKEAEELKLPCIVVAPMTTSTFTTQGKQRFIKKRELFTDIDSDDPLQTEAIYTSYYKSTWQFNLHSMNNDQLHQYEGYMWSLLLDTWDYDLDFDRKAKVLFLKDYTDRNNPVLTDNSLLFYPNAGDVDIVQVDTPNQEGFQVSVRVDFQSEVTFIRTNKPILETKLVYSILP